MPAYCGYARVPIAGMPGHRLRPLFHEIVGWNAMDLMREFLQKSRVEGLTNHGGYATITPTSIERLATLNGKSHKTPVRRQGTASETTPRITTHRRPVARPRMAQIPPPPPHGLMPLGQRVSCPLTGKAAMLAAHPSPHTSCCRTLVVFRARQQAYNSKSFTPNLKLTASRGQQQKEKQYEKPNKESRNLCRSAHEAPHESRKNV